jgi:hypothetical protein
MHAQHVCSLHTFDQHRINLISWRALTPLACATSRWRAWWLRRSAGQSASLRPCSVSPFWYGHALCHPFDRTMLCVTLLVRPCSVSPFWYGHALCHSFGMAITTFPHISLGMYALKLGYFLSGLHSMTAAGPSQGRPDCRGTPGYQRTPGDIAQLYQVGRSCIAAGLETCSPISHSPSLIIPD